MPEAHQTAAHEGGPRRLLALYPTRGRTPLKGLYLSHDLRGCRQGGRFYCYTNFIVSLDGRISLERPGGSPEVPAATANSRDWRLLLELAAPADALILSGRYVRQLAAGRAQASPPFQRRDPDDLTRFRAALGLPPQPVLVVMTNHPDLPLEALTRERPGPVLVVTSASALARRAPSVTPDGVELVAAGRERVEAPRLAAELDRRCLTLVYSIAGPAVLYSLLAGGLVDRLYLTTVLRVLGGDDYATMTRGRLLEPARDFRLAALYLDACGPGAVEQLLQVYDKIPAGAGQGAAI
jgi:riboflavin biosynthesis pyrimidine reductase